jgi:hypothetical protein
MTKPLMSAAKHTSHLRPTLLVTALVTAAGASTRDRRPRLPM